MQESKEQAFAIEHNFFRGSSCNYGNIDKGKHLPFKSKSYLMSNGYKFVLTVRHDSHEKLSVYTLPIDLSCFLSEIVKYLS